MIAARRACHRLLAAVAVLLAVLIALECTSAQVTGTEASDLVVKTALAEKSEKSVSGVPDETDAEQDDCRQLHPRRAPHAMPVPHGRPGSALIHDTGTAKPGLAVGAPLTGRRAVPLSRSGQLPVTLQIIRC
ncbi:hypothetical protein RKE29_27640 [Streptomyces sp. B1866]|uniref:hypothetical protein n=1 Tax=Streptomyces sp. B1866 TaxID=3075431 RepID=UPI00288E4A85|nr:hypothetical protein [Streptomyces sp. B1866]MDT3400339.1 hypothetical protein [Streptomyces sp. B1866]